MSSAKTAKSQSLKLGDLMVRDGLLTSDALQKALALQKQGAKSGLYKPLGQVCVELKLITRQDLQRFLSRYHKHIQIGELLMNMGLINQEQLNRVLEQQRLSPMRMGTLLVKSGVITESQLTDALSIQLGIPRIVPLLELISSDLLDDLDEDFVRKHICLPVHRQGNQIIFVMPDPLNHELLQTLIDKYKCKIVPAIAPAAEIQATINEIFLAKAEALATAQDSQTKAEVRMPDEREQITNLANVLLRSALEAGASSLHIESHEQILRVRLRIDGILSHLTDLPLELRASLFECFKAPFSGRALNQPIHTQIGDQRAELLLSSFYSQNGENLVLQVYGAPTHLLGIENLGFSPLNFNLYSRLLEQSGGVILAVGLERSGKSTLLSASLDYLNHPTRSMLALNTGFNHAIPGLLEALGTDSQNQNTRLQAMLSHDADVLMVSELNDRPTAEFVLQAALQGKKVLSSLCTFDATAGLYRLMQLQRSLLEAPISVSLVAQRLARRLCENCKQPYTPTARELKRLGLATSNAQDFPFYRPGSCQACKNQGYLGIAALHEIMILSPGLQDALLENKSAAGLRRLIRSEGQFVPILQDGIYKALQGITSIEELKRCILSFESDGLDVNKQQDIYELCQSPEGYLSLSANI